MKTSPHSEKIPTDPISRAAGAHKLGTNLGIAGGGIAGAAIGSALGPIGAVTGAAIGATAGAIAGRGIAEGIDPSAEETYWRESFRHEPYYQQGRPFDDYGPAYQLGWRLYAPDVSFEAAEKIMSDKWAEGRGSSSLEWSQAREAARAGWERIHRSRPENLR